MIKKNIQLLKSLGSMTAVYWMATMVANVLNWWYNVQLGRTLSKEEFATVTVFLSFQYLISVPASAFTSTLARFTAFYAARNETEKHFYFFRQYWWLTWLVSLTSLALFIFGKSIIASYFAISSPILLVIFAGILVPIFLLAFEKGALLGRVALGWLSLLTVLEAIVKLSVLAFGKSSAYPSVLVAVSALPISVFATWLISTMITRSYHPLPAKKVENKQQDIKDTYAFLGNAFFAGIGTVLFYNCDVLLAKHYLSLSDAGTYSTLSLLGKMLYFGAGSLIPLLIPLVAKAEAKNDSSRKPLYILLGIVGFVGLGVLSAYALFPHLTVSLLLGKKGLVTLPYLVSYATGMLFFVLSTCYTSYYLAKKNYLPAQIMIVAAGIEMLLLFFFHSSIITIVHTVLGVLVGLFVSLFLVDLFQLEVSALRENILTLLDFFTPLKRQKQILGKRILMFNWRDTKHVYAGGAELYMHEIAKALVQKDYQVTLFTSNDTKSKPTEIIDGVQIIRRGGFITVYLWAGLYLMTKLKNTYDVIFDSENGIPFFTPLFTRKPVILIMHHVHQDIFLRHLVPPFSWIANVLESYVMPIVYRKTAIVAVSPSTAQAISQQLQLHVDDIISTGVDTTTYLPGKKTHYPVISYVGRLKAYKGVSYLIQSFVKIHKKYPEARLIIAGDGEEKDKLAELIKSLSLQKVVSLKGKVTEEEKQTILRQSWIMVHPSYMEGWGITCLEANASGTPVLAADTPGLRDAVIPGKSGYLFPHGDSDSLAQELLRLIGQKKTLNALSKTSRDYSLSFSWSFQAEKFEKLCKRLWKQQLEDVTHVSPQLKMKFGV